LFHKCITKLSAKLGKLKIKILSYNEIEDDNENKATQGLYKEKFNCLPRLWIPMGYLGKLFWVYLMGYLMTIQGDT
jgi:hypothetical protein